MKRTTCLAIALCLASVWPLASEAQLVFDSAEKKAVIDAVCENLEREYIFPDVTEQYVRTIRGNLESGRYDGIEQQDEFARQVTDDLKAIHEDRHLHVRFDPEWIRRDLGRRELDDEALRLKEWRARTANHGFQEVKILPGNIIGVTFTCPQLLARERTARLQWLPLTGFSAGRHTSTHVNMAPPQERTAATARYQGLCE